MSRTRSRLRTIGAMVRKDLAEYRRDRLWTFLTILVLVVVVALFWILPNTVDESIDVGIAGLGDNAPLAGLEQERGLSLIPFASVEDLRAVVSGEAVAWTGAGGTVEVGARGSSPPRGAEQVDVAIGIGFPSDFVAAAAAGRQTEVTIYVDAGVPPDTKRAVSGLVRELALEVAGYDLPVSTPEPDQPFVVLGPDRAGNPVSARDSFRPVFVFLVLVMEMFVMASLIAREIQDRTVTAVLVTPASTADILAAKGITGTLSGMTQALIVLIAINSLSTHPGLIITLVLLGSIMVAGTAMIAGSSGKDFMSTLFYGMVYMVPLLIPAFAALFPGTASTWIRVLPSYPLVRALVDVTTYGAGWGDTIGELGALTAWCAALFGIGWLVLRRKVRTL